MSVDQAWVDAVAELWPGASVRVTTSADPVAAGRRELAFLPNAARPRLLLPVESAAASAAALRRYSHDLGLRQRISRSVSALALRSGGPQRALRDRLRIDGGGESVEDRLSELLGRRVLVSVGLGTARANRKPILHVLTPQGRALAFVKVGDTSTARALIAQEAAALRYLSTRSLPGVTVPEVLHLGDWQGRGLLVLSALHTSALDWRPRRTVPLAAMRTVFGAVEVRRAALADSTFWAAMTEVPAQVADGRRAERLAEVIKRVESAYGDVELDFGAWHGDWTPWNMAWHRGRVQLWDWERFSRDVPNGFDLLHYRLQEASRAKGADPYGTWPAGAVACLAPLGLTGRTALATLELYLLELCRRYQLAAQEPIGDPLRPTADRLLDLLAERAGGAHDGSVR